MRVAVTGASGRLGGALVRALGDAAFVGPAGPIAWTRADLDLDDAARTSAVMLDRDRPEVVVHTAAWTDVDACARQPELAMRRNGEATGALAVLCAQREIDLVAISTNEVFDGLRDHERGYRPGDAPAPGNAYGRSKLAGERAAIDAFERGAGRGSLGVVRTAWLYGPPGDDFPRKIVAAADRAVASGSALRLVEDEWGSPTLAADLADAIVELLAENALAGSHHLVNGGIASRAGWAEDVLTRVGVDVPIEHVGADTWERVSRPPRWGVLETTALPSGEPMRAWPAAMADYAPLLLRDRARATTAR